MSRHRPRRHPTRRSASTLASRSRNLPRPLVLAGITLFARFKPGEQLVAALGHSNTGQRVAFGRQREFNQNRVA